MTTIDVTKLRTRTVADLKPGDRVVSPGLGVAWHTRKDGTIASAMEWAAFEGRVFEILATDGTLTTARRDDGVEMTQDAGDLSREVLVLLDS
jgi:hypothetical protein